MTMPWGFSFNSSPFDSPQDDSGSGFINRRINPFASTDLDMGNYGGFNQSKLSSFLPNFGPDTADPSTIDISSRRGRPASYVDYTPSTTLRRYLDLTNEAPRREDYQPTKWGTALSTLTVIFEGMKDPSRGIQAALALRDRP